LWDESYGFDPLIGSDVVQNVIIIWYVTDSCPMMKTKMKLNYEINV
jgi:hypothetical protein